ncbi:hypothetical protein KIAC18_000275 [Sporomusa sphaeroides]|uniref:hypothetical protein n=1 Tax=Sporomusa sphaeroides TaxID=47679 RepID=UPI003DA15248
MNKEQVIEIAVAAALEWQKKQQQKQNKFRHDKRLRNTRLLLKHYPLLKEHCEKSVYMETDNANAIDILDDIDKYEGKTYIEAIKRSVARTNIIIQHIDTMLDIYEIYCQKSQQPEDMRRFRILKSKYFEGIDMSVMTQKEGIEERTYYRDIRDAISKLGSLIFGIDSLMDVT